MYGQPRSYVQTIHVEPGVLLLPTAAASDPEQTQ